MDIGRIISEIRRIKNAEDGFLPLYAPVFHKNGRKYVLKDIDSTYVSSVGEYVARFEKLLCEKKQNAVMRWHA